MDNNVEKLRKELFYALSSLSLDSFDKRTKLMIQKAINAADELNKYPVPSVNKILDIVYPVGSICCTYSITFEIIPPKIPGTWEECSVVAGEEHNNIRFWHRTK